MSQVVARLGKPHGIRGEMTVEVRTDDPDARFVAGAVFTTDPNIGELTLERARWHRDRMLLTFAEVASRTRAEEVRDTLVLVDAEDDVEEDDAWHTDDLVGLSVHLETGEQVGTVTDLTVGAVQDLLHVRTLAGEDRMVPFVEEIVPEVDLDEGRVIVSPPPGLLSDLDDSAEGSAD